MTNAPARRLKTYRSPGPMPGLRRYGRRKSGLVCSTHALQARTSKRSSSASGVLRRADGVYSDCIAFAGILRRDRSAAALLLRMTQPGSVWMPCSAVALPWHPANDPTWAMAHECGLVNSSVTQSGSLPYSLANFSLTQAGSLPYSLANFSLTQAGSLPYSLANFSLTQVGSRRNSRSPRLAPQWGCDMT